MAGAPERREVIVAECCSGVRWERRGVGRRGVGGKGGLVDLVGLVTRLGLGLGIVAVVEQHNIPG